MTEQRHAHQGLPDLKLHDPEHERSRRSVARAARSTALGVLLLLGLGLGHALYTRSQNTHLLEARAAENRVLHVLVTLPRSDAESRRLILPATLQGTQETQVYARASGYVKQWLKDMGSPVRKGEVLAILDLPELSLQVEQARASHELARTAFERWTRLRAEDAVSQQELDEKTSAYRQAEALLAQLRQQLAYGQVVAPFDGVVTRRNVNAGDLVNTGNTGPAQALFSLSQTERLHLYVYVPQDQAARIRVGERVPVTDPARPDQPAEGRIARTAGAIDPVARTLQVEVEVPNPQRSLLPGSYVEVGLPVAPSASLSLPTNTLLFGSAGPQVAVVKDNRVERRSVALGTDHGRTVEIRSGIGPDERVIINPPDAIAPGQVVIIEAGQNARRGS